MLTALERMRLNQARQLTVSQLYGRGSSMQQIADRLGISKSRVQQLLDGHHLTRYGQLLASYLNAAELADSAASFGTEGASVLVHEQFLARSVLSSRFEPDHHRAAQRWLGRARSAGAGSGAVALERSVLDLRTAVLRDGRLVAADFDRQQRLRILGGYHYGGEGRPHFPVASLLDAVTTLEPPSDG